MLEYMIKAAKLLVSILVIYLVTIVLLQRKMMYYPSKYPQEISEFVKQSGLQAIRYQVANHSQVAFYQPPESSNNPTCLWVIFGGNGAVALGWLNFIKHFTDKEVGFLLVDYPGYGFNEGQPSYNNNMTAAIESYKAFEAYQAAQGLQPRQSYTLNVLGHSLGSAIAVRFAETFTVDQLLLLSPFTSMKDMVRHIFPRIGWLLAPFLFDQYEVESGIEKLQAQSRLGSVRMIHGFYDEVVPVEMSRSMAKRFEGFVYYEELPNANHNFIDQYAKELSLTAQRLCSGSES